MIKNTQNLLIGLLLLLSAIFAITLTPKAVSESEITPVKLENMVPIAFGEWHTVDVQEKAIVSPEVETTLEKIYSDLLSRTYVNAKGDMIMLSLAYGKNQNRTLQVHKPEVCYRAQGFELKSMVKAKVKIDGRTVPTMHIVATQGSRTEPITYWIRSGDYIVRGWYEQNRARILGGLGGVIPDGILVRVSSISVDAEKAFIMQEKFIADMLKAIRPEDQHMFLGSGNQ